MKQIAVRIGEFVVNAGSQTIVLDRNVDVEKSNARSGNFPGKLESKIHHCLQQTKSKPFQYQYSRSSEHGRHHSI